MSVQIRYMGAKHDFAPTVAAVIDGLAPGPCLDLFAGMCSVAGALARSGRETWCNDVQFYAELVSRALVTSRGTVLDPSKAAIALFGAYVSNLVELKRRFRDDVRAEAVALQSGDWADLQDLMAKWRHAGNDADIADEVTVARNAPRTVPYRLATLTFAHGYFGVLQAIEIDSLRYAIDDALSGGRLSEEEARWAVVALLQTASHIASAPGHFAEYLHVRDEATHRRIRRVRRRSAWTMFQVTMERIGPYGSSAWRSHNRTSCSEATNVLAALRRRKRRPRVVYADPPYSRAQYSRYYHVLETLARYDYPEVTGLGRYRPNRFQTPFSHLSTVGAAFRSLADGTAAVGADLVLSYPSNGLLYEAGDDVATLLARSFKSVDVAVTKEKAHSTLGGAPGRASSAVREMVFVAKGARS